MADTFKGDLKDPETLKKYQKASEACNAALAKVVEASKPGTRVVELCALGDKMLTELTAAVDVGNAENGIAFPTCVSLNNTVANFNPAADNKTTLKEGDVVKIELGAHVDGYIAVGGHTFVSTAKPAEPLKGKAADVICAGYFALEAAMRLCRPGKSTKEVTDVVAKIANAFECTPVIGFVSNQMDRFVIEGEKQIENSQPEGKGKEFTFEEGEVYGLNVLISTGSGHATEKSEKPSVYKRDADVRYQLKMRAARQVFVEIKKNSPAFPFSVRNLKTKGARLGLTEMTKHEMLVPYPVYFEKDDALVAQFKTTILIQSHGISKLVSHAPAYVQSAFSVKDAALSQILAMPLTFE